MSDSEQAKNDLCVQIPGDDRHLPLTSHPNPRQVLVIDGGNGGVHEVLKHDAVEQAVLCDIDEVGC